MEDHPLNVRQATVAAPPSVGSLSTTPDPIDGVAGAPFRAAPLMDACRLPEEEAELFALAETMVAALRQYEEGLGVKHNPASVVWVGLVAAIAAVEAREAAVDAKQIVNQEMARADGEAKLYIASARVVLAYYYWPEWSDSWSATGFRNRFVDTSDSIAARHELLDSLRNHLVQNGGYENSLLNVTAARAKALVATLAAARANLAAALVLAGQRKAVCETAVVGLRRRVRLLIDELGLLMTEEDPRWHAFGLNPNATPSVPTVPELLVVTPSTPGCVNADWAAAARAAHYGVYCQMSREAGRFELMQVSDTDHVTLDSIPSGMLIRIRVTASNDLGESEPSETVEIQVP